MLNRPYRDPRMIRLRLRATDVDPVEYLRERFQDDLHAVVQPSDEAYPRLSVSSFCPDWPAGEIYSKPGEAFTGLADQLWFLSAFFVTQAVSRPLYHSPDTFSARRRRGEEQIVLAGTLGSYWDVMTPATLLLVMALYELPVPLDDLCHGMCAMLEDELSCASQTLSSRTAAISNARRMLAESHMPDSLRAFVPRGDGYRWQPAPEVVKGLRAGLLLTLEQMTSVEPQQDAESWR